MKYLVDIKETSYATVEVNADSKEMAEFKAQSVYYAGKYEWEDCTLTFTAHVPEKTGGVTR